MSVNWSWKHKMGEVSVERTVPDTGKKIRFKLNMYSANCLAAVIYEFKEKDNDNKVHNMYRFWCFWNDIKHLERCLGLRKDYDGDHKNVYNGSVDWDNWKKIKLNVYYKEMLAVAGAFAKAGHKVELYYKEPKKEKKSK